MRRLVLTAALGLALASPAAAQTWSRYHGGYSYDTGYDYSAGYRYDDRQDGWRGRSSDWNAVPSTFDWRSQLDRPGDYRCDAFWDASRTDCGAGWRDQRHRVSARARADYRELAGYRYGDGYGYGRRHGYDRYGSYGRHGYGGRGYGSAYRYGSGYDYGHAAGGSRYDGAYRRPDIVFPGGGSRYGGSHGYSGGGRDPGRIDWCRARYRSYDPGSGYYRAYSGHLVWCG